MEGSVVTPWGRSDQLRERRLPPGPGKNRVDVERSQRERLFGATVAVIDEVGYEGMSVGAIASRAGVSRSTFYEHFDGGRACFLATFEALMAEGLAVVSRAYEEGEGSWRSRLRRALDALFAAMVAQPAAARLCFIETYATGPPGAALRDRGIDALEALVRDALDQSPARADMPPKLVGAITGGIRVVTQTRLRRRREHELPGLTDPLVSWLSVYETPTRDLLHVPPPAPPEPRFVAESHRDRLFIALAEVVSEKGYTGTIVSDIVTQAGMSLSTFYDNFESKEDAFLAACDYGTDRALLAARAAWESERAAGWPLQVRAGMRELLSFLASEPAWSYMAMAEIFAAGPRARARRDRSIARFTEMVTPGRELEPGVDPVAVEALGGAIYSMMYDQIRVAGASRLPEILPATVFTLLAPFVGNGEAGVVAAS